MTNSPPPYTPAMKSIAMSLLLAKQASAAMSALLAKYAPPVTVSLWLRSPQ